MRSFSRVITLLLLLFPMAHTDLAQDKDSGVIEGRVYDLYEAVITNVPISIENVGAGQTINVRTDDSGFYTARIPPGRYQVSMSRSVGYPIPYQHACFTLNSAQKVIINFRPKPFSISDSIERGHWTESYAGALPSEATYFIQQSDGAIVDIRIQYQRLKTRKEVFEYKFSVIASFDRFTIYAESVILDRRKGKIVAEGNLLFEDGQQVRRGGKVVIDLFTHKAVVSN